MFKTDIDIPEEKGYIFAFISFRTIVVYRKPEWTKRQKALQFKFYGIWPEKMHYRLWLLYGKRKASLFSRGKLVFRFSSKDRYHCGLARTIFKSMMQGDVLVNVNQMTCPANQADNFQFIYTVLNIHIWPE